MMYWSLFLFFKNQFIVPNSPSQGAQDDLNLLEPFRTPSHTLLNKDGIRKDVEFT